MSVKTCRFIILMGLAAALAAVPLEAKAPRYTRLEPGREVHGILRTDQDSGWYRTYAFDLPLNAAAFRIRILDSEADLDLFLRHGETMSDYSEADFYSETDQWLEELHVYKAYETQVPGGRYYLDVAYQWDEPPRHGGTARPNVPYTLILEIFSGDEAIPLAPETLTEATLSSENGYLALFKFDISESSSDFRIDVPDSAGDIDLFLSRDNPAPTKGAYTMIQDTMLGRESLILENADPGRYYLTVLEATEIEQPVELNLLLSLGSEPSALLPEVPDLKLAYGPSESTRLATVQLIGEYGIGSGCFVGDEGYILTNHHVVVDPADRVLPEMVVALCLDPFEAPLEAYLAEIVETSPEDDLALLRIIGDRWGRPLPPDYRFPFWRLGDPALLRPGDNLVIMGYPWIGSGLSRPFFTRSRGILSGGERSPAGLMLKTDAVISGGGSGGAVTDGSGRLLGLPTFVVSDDGAQLTYFTPVDRIPRDWRELF